MNDGDEVDYTKARKGRRERGGKIEVCPRCGRKGYTFAVQFNKGDPKLMVTHRKVFAGTHWRVTDFCMAPMPPPSR